MPDHIDTDAVIAQLNGMDRMSEAAHVTTFRCHREAADGYLQEITVEIYDSGPDVDHPTLRYRCEARGEGGVATSGNSAAQVSTVLALVHWHELD